MKTKILEIESCLDYSDKGVLCGDTFPKDFIVGCVHLKKPTPIRGILSDCPLPDKKDVNK